MAFLSKICIFTLSISLLFTATSYANQNKQMTVSDIYNSDSEIKELVDSTRDAFKKMNVHEKVELYDSMVKAIEKTQAEISRIEPIVESYKNFDPKANMSDRNELVKYYITEKTINTVLLIGFLDVLIIGNAVFHTGVARFLFKGSIQQSRLPKIVRTFYGKILSKTNLLIGVLTLAGAYASDIYFESQQNEPVALTEEEYFKLVDDLESARRHNERLKHAYIAIIQAR